MPFVALQLHLCDPGPFNFARMFLKDEFEYTVNGQTASKLEEVLLHESYNDNMHLNALAFLL